MKARLSLGTSEVIVDARLRRDERRGLTELLSPVPDIHTQALRIPGVARTPDGREQPALHHHTAGPRAGECR
jgi:hypothetical protein